MEGFLGPVRYSTATWPSGQEGSSSLFSAGPPAALRPRGRPAYSLHPTDTGRWARPRSRGPPGIPTRLGSPARADGPTDRGGHPARRGAGRPCRVRLTAATERPCKLLPCRYAMGCSGSGDKDHSDRTGERSWPTKSGHNAGGICRWLAWDQTFRPGGRRRRGMWRDPSPPVASGVRGLVESSTRR